MSSWRSRCMSRSRPPRYSRRCDRPPRRRRRSTCPGSSGRCSDLPSGCSRLSPDTLPRPPRRAGSPVRSSFPDRPRRRTRDTTGEPKVDRPSECQPRRLHRRGLGPATRRTRRRGGENEVSRPEPANGSGRGTCSPDRGNLGHRPRRDLDLRPRFQPHRRQARRIGIDAQAASADRDDERLRNIVV